VEITDLEFIRDFSDDLAMLRSDLGGLAESMENDDDLPPVYVNALWSLTHQADLIEKILEKFRKEVNAKYWLVWKTAYPQMTDKDIDHPEVQEEIRQAVAKALKENEGVFPKIDEQFTKIQEERLNEQ